MDKTENLADELNQFATQIEVNQENVRELSATDQPSTETSAEELSAEQNAAYDSLFEKWDEREFAPQDFMINGQDRKSC